MISRGSPWFSVSQHCVEDDEELAHGGDDSDLCRLTGGAEPMIGFGEGQVAADRDQDGHVEGRPDTAAATSDSALPAPFSHYHG
jgi:hypothetical protein